MCLLAIVLAPLHTKPATSPVSQNKELVPPQALPVPPAFHTLSLLLLGSQVSWPLCSEGHKGEAFGVKTAGSREQGCGVAWVDVELMEVGNGAERTEGVEG